MLWWRLIPPVSGQQNYWIHVYCGNWYFPFQNKSGFFYIIIFFFFLHKHCFGSISYGHVTLAGEGLQNPKICSAPMIPEQGGVIIVPHLLWHGASGFHRLKNTLQTSRESVNIARRNVFFLENNLSSSQ